MSNIKDEMLIENDDDLALVSSCKKGDLNAFEVIVGKYQRKLLNTAYLMVGDYEEACDIVQDAFISAFRNLKSFEGRGRFSTWLFAIVINVSKNHLKQMKSRRFNEQVSFDDPDISDNKIMKAARISDAAGIDDRIERIETEKNVRGCINKLESEFKEVLVLRDIHGFSYDEIGSMMKIAEGTVKSRLFRAREFVKECLKKVYGEL